MTSSCPLLESSMPHYAALDVSNEQTAIHVVDEAGRTVWRGKRASDPEALATALRRHAPDLVRVGLETGFLTPWLYHSLKAAGLPVVCIEARHARAATALQRNKTDANDAETLAQLVRTGWYREARVKSFAAHAMRHLVGARAQLMGVSVDLSNQIRSTLKTEPPRVSRRPFCLSPMQRYGLSQAGHSRRPRPRREGCSRSAREGGGC